MLHYYFINGDCFGYVPNLKRYIRFVSFEEFVDFLKTES